MRKSFQAFGLGAIVAVSVGVYAADPLDVQPESRAYLNFNFGGAPETKQEWHYGLQFGQRAQYSRDGEVLRPASDLKINYSNTGNNLLVNGKPLRQRSYRLNQAEGEAAAAAAAEEPGFFEGIGNWFGGLFGGDEEAAPAAEGEAAAAEEPGFFDSYTFADYALLGVGVVGVGYAIMEVADSEDSPDPAPTTTGGETEGGTTTVGNLGGLVGNVLGLGYRQSGDAYLSNPEYREWLDGGTGQMGDIGQ